MNKPTELCLFTYSIAKLKASFSNFTVSFGN